MSWVKGEMGKMKGEEARCSRLRGAEAIKKGNSGFTAVELMVVIVVLGILMAIAAPKVTGTIDQAKVKACDANRLMLQNAVDRYAVDHMDASGNYAYPQSLSDLVGKYIEALPKCPVTGNDYTYENHTVTCNHSSQ